MDPTLRLFRGYCDANLMLFLCYVDAILILFLVVIVAVARWGRWDNGDDEDAGDE